MQLPGLCFKRFPGDGGLEHRRLELRGPTRGPWKYPKATYGCIFRVIEGQKPTKHLGRSATTACFFLERCWHSEGHLRCYFPVISRGGEADESSNLHMKELHSPLLTATLPVIRSP